MATSVQDIYKRFLAQIGQDVIAELEQELAEELMLIYLEGAISMFDICENIERTIYFSRWYDFILAETKN